MTNEVLIARIAAERPEPPAGFDARQDAMLRSLIGKVRTKMKRKMSAILIAAMIGLFLFTAAAAAEISGIDLFSFLKSNRHQDVLDQTREAVQYFEALSYTFPGVAEVTVTEALYDGQFMMVYMNVKPLRDDLLIIPDGFTESNMQSLNPEAEPETVSEYAQRSGLELWTIQPRMAYLSPDSDLLNYVEKSKDGVEAALHQDGALDFLVLGSYYTFVEADLAKILQNGYFPIQLSIQLHAGVQAEADPALLWSTDVLLPYRPFKWWSSAAPRIAIPQCGVLLDGVAFHGFLLSSKLDIHFTVNDQDVYRQLNGGLRFEALDKEGQPLDSSFHTGYEKITGDIRHINYWQVLSLPATEASPETIILRAYSCNTNETYEILEIPLTTHEIPEELLLLSPIESTNQN